ncbi:hypothetical protein MASR2M15_28090 [Anaerolineales bacterium]
MAKENLDILTAEIAKAIGETDPMPINQIRLIIKKCGIDFVREVVNETKDIYENGGLKTHDRDRKRTLGGTFFFIAKGKIPYLIRQEIFPTFGQKGERQMLQWEERIKIVDDLMNSRIGWCRNISVTLKGRIKEFHIEGDTVIAIMQHVGANTPVPAGVPIPPKAYTRYVVYISLRQWELIESRLSKKRKDEVVIEGTCYFDNETQSIAVFAQHIDTAALLKEKNREQDESPKQVEVKEIIVKKPPVRKAPKRNIPARIPSNAKEKLRELYDAMDKLENRIKRLEADGEISSVALSKKLLINTQRQIDALLKKHSIEK